MRLANDWISVISLIVSVLLTISIFIATKILNDNAEERAKKYNTLVYASTQFSLVDEAVSAKVLYEEKKNPGFTYEYIRNNAQIESSVFKILNAYSAIGTAMRTGLVAAGVVRKLRQEAIIRTWYQYENYINKYRCENDEGAWTDFEFLAKEMMSK